MDYEDKFALFSDAAVKWLLRAIGAALVALILVQAVHAALP